MKLMDWDPNLRYRIMGKLIRTKEMSIFVFDLKEPEKFKRGGKAEYPDGWGESFGVLADEHEKDGLVNFCENDSVFYMEKGEEKTEKNVERRQPDE